MNVTEARHINELVTKKQITFGICQVMNLDLWANRYIVMKI
jgi:hypothetical protein